MIRLLCWLVAAMVSAAIPAYAHAFLEHAEPPVGSEVAASPRQLVLTFTEGVEPMFSAIVLQDNAGGAVATGKPHTQPDDNHKLAVELPQLRRGNYTVIWRVTSVDTHKTEGRFQFTVTQ